MTKRIKKTVALIVIVGLLFITIGCTTHIHKVGSGPQTYREEMGRQWYVLFGLVPLNEIDTNAMAGNVADYEITTEVTFIDILIGIPASWVTVSSRTVTVTK